jgi:hypothetical protein
MRQIYRGPRQAVAERKTETHTVQSSSLAVSVSDSVSIYTTLHYRPQKQSTGGRSWSMRGWQRGLELLVSKCVAAGGGADAGQAADFLGSVHSMGLASSYNASACKCKCKCKCKPPLSRGRKKDSGVEDLGGGVYAMVSGLWLSGSSNTPTSSTSF